MTASVEVRRVWRAAIWFNELTVLEVADRLAWVGVLEAAQAALTEPGERGDFDGAVGSPPLTTPGSVSAGASLAKAGAATSPASASVAAAYPSPPCAAGDARTHEVVA